MGSYGHSCGILGDGAYRRFLHDGVPKFLSHTLRQMIETFLHYKSLRAILKPIQDVEIVTPNEGKSGSTKTISGTDPP